MIRRALVVGGGPAGMTAAIALARAGVECEIAELATDWRPAGIGIGLQSPPMRALRKLDLLDALLARSCHHTVIDMMRAGGAALGQMPQMNVLGPDDPPFVTMSRMTLHEVLAERLQELGVPVHLGVTVRSLDGRHATLTDGRADEWDLVVGADGLRSTVRAMLLPGAPAPAYAGQSIWRMDVSRPDRLEHYTIMIGRQTRVGLVPIAVDRAYVWMLDSTLGPERPPADQIVAGLQERLSDYGFVVPEVAAQISTPEQIDFRALHWLLLTPPWHNGSGLLIGDAAHTTTPHMAWGVGLAIEDALVLGELVRGGFEGDELGRALASRRFERCRLVVEGSLQLSRWEREPDAPDADPGGLIGRTFQALAGPI